MPVGPTRLTGPLITAVAREDIAHNFKLSSIYEIPRLHLTGIAAGILNGWGISSNVAWRGGFPFQLRSGRDNSFSGVGRDRPDFIGTDIHTAQLSSDRPHGEMVIEFLTLHSLCRTLKARSATREGMCCVVRSLLTPISEC